MAASSHACGGMVHKERRRLRKQPSLTLRPVEVAEMRCIRGGRGRDWVLLPCVDVSGRPCVQLTTGSQWLRHCLGVRRGRRRHVAGVVRGLMVECMNAFESSHESGQCGAPGPAKAPPPRKRILDSDDEADLAPDGVEPRGGGKSGQARNPRSQLPKARRSKRGEFVTLTVRGMKLTFTVLPGRRMHVPVEEGKSLQMIIEHIASCAPKEGVEESPDFAALLKDSERTFIGWRGAKHDSKFHGKWYFRYEGPDGCTRTLGAGFQVPRRSLSGEIYTALEALRAAEQVLLRVKKTWNEHDHSDRARFDLTS